jgi:hypothetical protein
MTARLTSAWAEIQDKFRMADHVGMMLHNNQCMA